MFKIFQCGNMVSPIRLEELLNKYHNELCNEFGTVKLITSHTNSNIHIFTFLVYK